MLDNIDGRYILCYKFAICPKWRRLQTLAKSGSMERLTPPGSKAQGVVAGDSIVSFFDNVSGQSKADVLDSTMLAQITANHDYPDHDDANVDKWYKRYNEILQNLGWEVKEMDFTAYDQSSATLRMDEVVLELIPAIATQNTSLILKATLDAIKALPKEDGNVKLFDFSSEIQEVGKLQVYVCSRDKDGNVSAAFTAFKFKHIEKTITVLFWDVSSADVEVRYAKHTMTFDTGKYSCVRQSVKEKLRDHTLHFIDSLDISVAN